MNTTNTELQFSLGDKSREDDLHDLLAIAVLCVQKKVLDQDLSPIFKAWEAVFPDDAYAMAGRALPLILEGKMQEAYAILEEASKTAVTRRAMAAEMLEALHQEMTA